MAVELVQTQQFTEQNTVTLSASELEFQLTRDPLSFRGREYRKLLEIRREIKRETIYEFLCFLAKEEFLAQRRAQEQLARELDDEYELSRRRQLKAWADAQATESKDSYPDSLKNLLNEILLLLSLAGKLTVDYLLFVAEQKRLSKEWHGLHQVRAERLINNLLYKIGLVGPDNKPLLATDAIKQRLVQAWMPAPPALMFKYNPSLAKKVLGIEDQPSLLATPSATITPDPAMCHRVAQVQDVLGEFSMLAKSHNNSDPNAVLSGLALLAVVRANREAMAAAALANQDRPRIAEMIGQGARLAVDMQANRKAFSAVERQTKDRMQTLNNELAKLELTQAELPRRRSPSPYDISAGPSHPSRRKKIDV